METPDQLEMQSQNHRGDITEARVTLTMKTTLSHQRFKVILIQGNSVFNWDTCGKSFEYESKLHSHLRSCTPAAPVGEDLVT